MKVSSLFVTFSMDFDIKYPPVRKKRGKNKFSFSYIGHTSKKFVLWRLLVYIIVFPEVKANFIGIFKNRVIVINGCFDKFYCLKFL